MRALSPQERAALLHMIDPMYCPDCDVYGFGHTGVGEILLDRKCAYLLTCPFTGEIDIDITPLGELALRIPFTDD